MCAYIVVAIELWFFVALFWFIFIYEPGPYQIKGDPWGLYEKPRDLGKPGSQHMSTHS